MSFQHDQMAHIAATKLIADIRSSNCAWLPANRLTINSTYWQGVIDWPRPDNAFQDSTTGASLALEFKPVGHGKSEYVRGLGQALTYLDRFELATLIVPYLANDGFEIATYLEQVLTSNYSSALSVGLVAYGSNPSELVPIVPVRARVGEIPALPTGRAVFWAYWRDLSQFDLFFMLDLIDKRQCDFGTAYDLYWKRFRLKGSALTWEKRPRKTPLANKSNKSEKANDGLSFRHIGLINSSSQLTAEGYELLRIGKIYSPDSEAFLSRLAYQVLMHGRHLELIFWVEEAQKQLSLADKSDNATFVSCLDARLQRDGIIASTPNPTGKTTFLRDEQKLWNKLGLLITSGSNYFFPNEGYRFNWRRIVSIVGTSSV